MLSPDDKDLVRREPGIPGLATVLDGDAFLAALRPCVPEADFKCGEITYVKYKPGTNCLVGYRLHTADASVDLYAKAYGQRDREKLQQVLKQPCAPGPFGPGRVVLQEAGVEVWFFPNDAELGAIRTIMDNGTGNNVLQRVLPDRRDLWDAPRRCLSYKPERRYVARLVTGEDEGAVLRVYTQSQYEAAALASAEFTSRGPLRVPGRIGRSERLCIMVQDWLPGRLLDEVLGDPQLDLQAVEQVGAALAELHQQNPKRLAERSSNEEKEALVAVANWIGEMCPDLAGRAGKLIKWFTTRLMRPSRTCRPIHGDFYAKQVLLTGDRVAILDLDRAARRDPALDLGNFIAHLERDALCNRLPADRVEPVTAAFLEGYRLARRQPNSSRVLRCTAAGLLRLAPEPFRCREPNWRQRAEAIFQRAEEIFVSTLSRPAVPAGGAGTHRRPRPRGAPIVTTPAKDEFCRDDGKSLRVVPGFRSLVLNYRAPVTPKEDWSDKDYNRAAKKKIKRTRRLVEAITRRRGTLEGAEVLDVGCGDGINDILIALEPVRRVTGIDLGLRLFEAGPAGERVRRLVQAIFKRLDVPGTLDEVLKRLPIELVEMDATRMTLADDSFDLVLSRSAVEHIQPIEGALAEMARVVRPNGLIQQSIDPFYWLRGCHKRGVVTIPWAHARLSLDEYRRFVTESEGAKVARKRCRRLETLNRFTLKQWREVIGAGPFEFLEWKEEVHGFAASLLKQHPDVADTLLDGVDPRELTCGRVELWLRYDPSDKQLSESTAHCPTRKAGGGIEL